jgi:hypothetical protein
MAAEKPFDFVKRRHKGCCSDTNPDAQPVMGKRDDPQCKHSLVVDNDTDYSCAFAQQVNGLPDSAERFEGNLGSSKPLMQAKTTF